MEVGGIEAGECLQGLEVVDFQHARRQRYQSLSAQLLQRSIDVHRRERDRVGQLHLRQRQLTTAAVAQSDRIHARKGLAQQVCETLEGGALPDVDQPFAGDRLLDQRDSAQRLADAWIALDQPEQLFASKRHDVCGRQRADRVRRCRHEQLACVAQVPPE